MPEWLIVVLSVAGGIVLFWLALLVVLWVQQRRAGAGVDWRGILRLVPDVIRLLRRLASSKDVPRGVRWMLLALLGYLLLPIDLVPDFLPVIGYADDAIIVAIVLRFAIRHAGIDAVRAQWPGTPEGLDALLALCGISSR